MELGSALEAIISVVTALGGLSLIKFLFFMKPERRLKDIEADEKELGVLKGLIDSLNTRIEQQDNKIRELNERVDRLYQEKHELEAEKNQLMQENSMLKLQLKEAEHNICVRPDDECLKRMPPRDYCRLKKLAKGDYDKYYDLKDVSDNNVEESKTEEK